MPIPQSTRRLLWAAMLAAGGLSAYALLIEPRWLQVKRSQIYVHTLPTALSGLRIALLTDFHAGGGTPLSLVRRACQKAMAEHPDLIALTGDFVTDYATSFDAVLDVLACLAAPLGVYAVPGNHDYRVGIDTWQRQFTKAPGIHNVTNRAIIRLVHGRRLCIAGWTTFHGARHARRYFHLPISVTLLFCWLTTRIKRSTCRERMIASILL